MSTTPGGDNVRAEDRDPEELQREADAIRADLERTLNALERKLSPKRLLDRSVSYVQENSADLLQKMGATVSRNPLPFLAAAAGLISIAALTRRSRSRQWRTVSSVSPRRGDFDRTSQSFSSQSSGSQSFNESTGRARRTAERFKESASETLDRTRARTAEWGRDFSDLVQEQPLVCGAIALAVGAIVGAALPATQVERDLVARARNATDALHDELQPDTTAMPETPPPISH